MMGTSLNDMFSQLSFCYPQKFNDGLLLYSLRSLLKKLKVLFWRQFNNNVNVMDVKMTFFNHVISIKDKMLY